MIAGKTFGFWFKLFNLCYEWRYDGGESPANAKGKVVKTGFYTRICLPQAGGILEQRNLVMDILQTMAQRYDELHQKRIKK